MEQVLLAYGLLKETVNAIDKDLLQKYESNGLLT